MLQEGIWWKRALRTAAADHNDESLWGWLTHTEVSANFLFCTMIRTQAALFDQLILRYRGYPFKLVELLCKNRDSATLAAVELLSAPACTVDSYATSLRSRYNTVDLLLSDDCLLQLRAVLHNIIGTTFAVERLHSFNLRSIKSRCMTHSLTLEDMAVLHTAGKPVPQSGLYVVEAERRVAKLEEKHRKAKTLHGGETSGKRKRQGGGGGAWRAFLHIAGQKIHARQRQLQGEPDGLSTSQRYRNLSDADRADLKTIGALATMRHQAAQPAFPDTDAKIAQEMSRASKAASNRLLGTVRESRSLSFAPDDESCLLSCPLRTFSFLQSGMQGLWPVILD